MWCQKWIELYVINVFSPYKCVAYAKENSLYVYCSWAWITVSVHYSSYLMAFYQFGGILVTATTYQYTQTS